MIHDVSAWREELIMLIRRVRSTYGSEDAMICAEQAETLVDGIVNECVRAQNEGAYLREELAKARAAVEITLEHRFASASACVSEHPATKKVLIEEWRRELDREAVAALQSEASHD